MLDWRLRVRDKNDDEMPWLFIIMCMVVFVLIAVLLDWFRYNTVNNNIFLILTVIVALLGLCLLDVQYKIFELMNYEKIEKKYLEINGDSEDDDVTMNHVEYIKYKVEKRANDHAIIIGLLSILVLMFPILKSKDLIEKIGELIKPFFEIMNAGLFPNATMILALIVIIVILLCALCLEVRRRNDIEDIITKMSLDFYFRNKKEIKVVMKS